jgi:predicted RecB family nuclease
LGIRTLTHLENCDPVKVSQGLRKHKQYVGPPIVFGWQLQARSYKLGRPLRLREDTLTFSKFVAIDLEYDSIKGGLVWLIGFALVDGSDTRVIQLWADNPTQEKRNIERLIQMIAQEDVQVVTWSGCSAEIPTLRKAAFRSGISIAPLVERHVDLFRFIDRNYRFPTKWLGLKSLGNFLGLDRCLEVTGGFEAQMLWQEFQRTSGTAKKLIKQELLGYNRDDLRVLAEIAKGLQAESGLLACASNESSF